MSTILRVVGKHLAPSGTIRTQIAHPITTGMGYHDLLPASEQEDHSDTATSSYAGSAYHLHNAYQPFSPPPRADTKSGEPPLSHPQQPHFGHQQQELFGHQQQEFFDHQQKTEFDDFLSVLEAPHGNGHPLPVQAYTHQADPPQPDNNDGREHTQEWMSNNVLIGHRTRLGRLVPHAVFDIGPPSSSNAAAPTGFPMEQLVPTIDEELNAAIDEELLAAFEALSQHTSMPMGSNAVPGPVHDYQGSIQADHQGSIQAGYQGSIQAGYQGSIQAGYGMPGAMPNLPRPVFQGLHNVAQQPNSGTFVAQFDVHYPVPLTQLVFGNDPSFSQSRFQPPAQIQSTADITNGHQRWITSALNINTGPSTVTPPNPPLMGFPPPPQSAGSSATRGGNASVKRESPGALTPSSPKKRKREPEEGKPDDPNAVPAPPAKRKKAGPAKTPRVNLTPEQRQQNHILSEQKRRSAILDHMSDLKLVVPGADGNGMSKSDTLTHIYKWLEKLQKGNVRLKEALGEV